MKRSYLGLFLLVLLLALSLLGSRFMGEVQVPVLRGLQQAQQLSLEGRWEEAAEQAEAAWEHWDGHLLLQGFFADHNALEQIQGGFAQLSVYGRNREAVAFAALCAQLRSQVEAVGKAHDLNLQNLM